MPNPRAQKNANLRSTATGVYDAVTQGLLPMLGNAARGSVAATGGFAGDMLGLLWDGQPLPTSQNLLDIMPTVGSDKNIAAMGETMGGFVPTPGAGALAKAIGRGAKTALNPMTYGRAFVEAQAPAVMSPITAWHGSPHKFRKFDNSKMGTGEGAQAYGAGAYLADARGVAEEYRRALSEPALYFPDGTAIQKAQGGSASDQAKAFLEDAYASQSSSPFQFAERRIKEQMQYAKNKKDYEDALNVLADWESKGAKIDEGGYLYKADIPDEAVANMLLWDKPLSEQPEAVKKGLSLLDPDTYSPTGNDYDPSELGQMIYNRLANQARDYGITSGKNSLTTLPNSQAKASQDLLSFGIPGIRYLDAGSRGQGAGTMNTVVFDDSIIKILERNGVPLGLLAD